MKKFLIMIVVFAITFSVLYGFFSGRWVIVKDFLLPRPDTSQEMVAELRARYYGVSPFWLERYGVSVREAQDILEDADEDGLSLFEEYQNLTDPFNADSDGDGMTDASEVRQGFSPTGSGRLDQNRNGLPDPWEQKYALGSSLVPDAASATGDPDDDGLINRLEFLYGTNPMNPDSDGDSFIDGKEVRDSYDPTVGGDVQSAHHIIIDKINIDAPVILSKNASEDVLQQDLEKGVIHYPGMAMPGRRGNAYIAGHSSNYSWSLGNFNSIFKDLKQVVPGDMITITETNFSGKEVRHRYEVVLQEEVAADDARIFEASQTSILTLTTCWPIGTADRRIMVKARLVDSDEEIVYTAKSETVAGEQVASAQ